MLPRMSVLGLQLSAAMSAGLREQVFGGRLAPERFGNGGDSGRVGPDRGQADPGIADHPVLQPHRGAAGDHRPITRAPLDLLIGAGAAGPQRDADLCQKLRRPTAVS